MTTNQPATKPSDGAMRAGSILVLANPLVARMKPKNIRELTTHTAVIIDRETGLAALTQRLETSTEALEFLQDCEGGLYAEKIKATIERNNDALAKAKKGGEG